MQQIAEQMVEEELRVSGVAIHEGVSRNGVFYSAEELKKFTKTLQGVSIIKDHFAIVDNTIGVVDKTRFDESTASVMFEGWIKDSKIGERIKDGRVKHVSIGALVEKIVIPEGDDNPDHVIAKGLTGVELSTVVVPGIPGASITHSLSLQRNAKTAKERSKTPSIFEDVSKFTKLVKKDEVDQTTLNTTEQGVVGNESDEGETMEETNDKDQIEITSEDIKDRVNEEVQKKMSEEKINELQASVEEKASLLEEKETALQEKDAKIREMETALAKVAEEKKNALVSEYKALCDEKGVETKDTNE